MACGWTCSAGMAGARTALVVAVTHSRTAEKHRDTDTEKHLDPANGSVAPLAPNSSAGGAQSRIH